MNNAHSGQEPEPNRHESDPSHVASLWEQFTAQVPTDLEALEEICKRLHDAGAVRCRYCGNATVWRNYGQRTAKCQRCYKTFSVTAGTFFDHMKSPRAWLAGIFLTGNGVTISSSAFHKLTGFPQSSAHELLTKIRMAIQFQMPDNVATVHTRFFIEIFSRRSRQTPAGAHPRGEQDEIDKRTMENGTVAECGAEAGAYQKDKDSVAACLSLPELLDDGVEERQMPSGFNSEAVEDALTLRLSPQDEQIHDLLLEQDLQFDELMDRTGMLAREISASLSMLELAGLVRRLPGDVYTRGAPERCDGAAAKTVTAEALPRQIVQAIADFEQLAKRIFHGISRRLVQPYLAAFWCHVRAARWSTETLFSACIGAGPIYYRDILAYVSPPQVKFVF